MTFPKEVHHLAGRELMLVQIGREPNHWRPMPSIGKGVNELRIKIGQIFRVFYIAKFPTAVYVLHAFEKKDEKTPKADLDIARDRLAELIRIAHS
jgi:phage-related protein